MIAWPAIKLFLDGIIKWLKDNPKAIIVVLFLAFVWWNRHDAANEVRDEIIKEDALHVAKVKDKQNIAAANRPASRADVIERLRQSRF